MRYALLTGTGRSGTNWTLDILDASPQTHCRNEPHAIAGTQLRSFPRVWTSDDAGSVDLYRSSWDQIAVDAARRCGERDHHIRYPKPYLHPWTNRLGLTRVITGPRVRRSVGRLDPRLRSGEFELPVWLGSQARLAQSLGVLKILSDAPLLAWLLQERPQVPVIHIVRHPGGRLNSWLSRLVAPMPRDQLGALLADRVDKIERIRAYDEEWRALIPEPSSLSLVKLELWFWRYVNETTLLAGRAHDRYRFMRFDDLAHDPVVQSELAYRHLGLDWTEEVRERVLSDTSTSVFGPVGDSRAVADAWRRDLDPEHAEAIDEVVGGSMLHELLR